MSKASKAAKRRKQEARRKRKEAELQAKRDQQQKQAQKQMDQPPPPADPVANDQKEQPTPVPANQSAGNQNNREGPRRAEWSVWLQVVFSFCIVLFTAVQSVTSYMQWDATNNQYKVMIEQNDVAKEQLAQAAQASAQISEQIELMYADQRAWLVAEPPTLLPSTPGQLVRYGVTVKNIGKTPAKLLTIVHWGAVSEQADIENEMLRWRRNLRQSKANNEHVIAPGATWGMSNLPMAKEADGATDIDIKNDDVVAWIFVTVTYLDSRGQQHTTEQWFTSARGEGKMRGLASHGQMD